MGDFASLFVSVLANMTIFIIVIYSIIAFFATIKKLSDVIDDLYMVIRMNFVEKFKVYKETSIYKDLIENLKLNFAYFLVFLPGFLIFILGISEILRGNFILLW